MNVKFISETSLIEGCLRQNKQAQNEFYNKYARKMYAICCRYANNYQIAEDILQESFIKIFDNLKKYKGEGSFEGWMKRIVINTALETFRKKKINIISMDNENFDFDIPCEESQVSPFSVKEITDMIQTIHAGYREVLNLFIIDGYSHKEIAKMLGITEENSKLRLNRARNILKKIMLQKNTICHEQIS